MGLQIDSAYLRFNSLAYEPKGIVSDAFGELARSLPVLHALLSNAYATEGRKSEALSGLNVSPNHRVREVSDRNQKVDYLDYSFRDTPEHMLYLRRGTAS